MSALNITARAFRALHKPGQPLLLLNVYDAITARAVAALPICHALATTSGAVAAAVGLDDNDMDMETNLRAVRVISKVAQEFQKPLTVDFQSGYGDQLEVGIQQLLSLGVVGLNLEDVDSATGKMYSIDEASSRIAQVMRIASSQGVPDFVVNARADSLLHGGTIEETIRRGKSYLAAGAANVFVIGGANRGGLSDSETKKLAEAFHGKLNVMIILKTGHVTTSDIASLGVARCSIGSQLRVALVEAVTEFANKYLGHGG